MILTMTNKMLKKLNNRKGMTLAEVLTVAAIILILAGFAFVAVSRYQKSLKQTELDNTAEEIFVAAQNHASVSKAAGSWEIAVDKYEKEDKNKTENGPLGTHISTADKEALPDYPESEKGSKATHNYYTITVDANHTVQNSILSYLLPTGAIDESVRANGNIVIEYDAETAAVYAVWYCEPSKISELTDNYQNTFTSVIDNNWRDEYKTSHRDERKKAKPQIGYYGGAAVLNKKAEESKKPEGSAIVENNDELTIYAEWKKDINITARITGQESGAVYDAINGWKTKGESKYFVIDSVSESGKHFSRLGKEFIPGENLNIDVYFSTDSKFTPDQEADSDPDTFVKKSIKNINSLFANGSCSGTEKTTAHIQYARHLQNLNTEVSGVNSNNAETVTNAVLANSIDWDRSFTDASDNAPGTIGIGATTSDNPGIGSRGDIQIYDNSNNPIDDTNSFLSIYNENLTSFNGNGMNIDNINMIALSAGRNSRQDPNGNAGLFATGAAGLSIQDLTMIDPYARGTKSVGALIGYADENTTINNVVVYNSSDTAYWEEEAGIDASISGADSDYYKNNAAGGLVGYSRVITVSGSSASLRVRAAHRAGGLIGEIDTNGNNTSEITNSYVGGNNSGEGENRQYNIIALDDVKTARAGGFIGVVDDDKENNPSIVFEYCYTTASASGYEAGGFISHRQKINLTFSNVYTDNFVNGTREGLFIAVLQNRDNITVPDGSEVGSFALKGQDNIKLLADKDGNEIKIDGINVYSSKDVKEKLSASITITAEPYHTELGTTYPYMNTGKKHYGDWNEPVDSRSFKYDFAVLYYERVQHGYDENSVSWYYHGYDADAKEGGKTSNDYEEVDTGNTLPANVTTEMKNGLLTAPYGNEFVTEDGYLILIDKKKYGQGSDGSGLVTISSSWGNSLSLEDAIDKGIFEEYQDVLKHLNINGYEAYLLNLSQAREWNNDKPFNFYVNNAVAAFHYVPIFADCLLPTDVPAKYEIRSASQLHNLFDVTSGSNYLSTSGNPKNVVTQTMDIDFDSEKVKFYKKGQPVNYDLTPVLSELAATYQGGHKFAEDNSDTYYSLKNLNRTLIRSIHNNDSNHKLGILRNLVIDNFKNQDNSIVGTNNGVIENITVNNAIAKSAIAESNALADAKITNCIINNCNLSESGVVASSNAGSLSLLNIKNSTIGGAGISFRNSGSIENCVINNSVMSTNGVVGTDNTGVIKTIHINDSSMANGAADDSQSSASIEDFYIKNCLLTKNGIANKIECNVTNYQIYGSSIKGDGFYNRFDQNGKKLLNSKIINTTISGNGIGSYNGESILQDISIINAHIGKYGALQENKQGVLTNVQIYSDKSLYKENKYYKYYEETIDPDADESESGYGYNLVTVGYAKQDDGEVINSYESKETRAGLIGSNGGEVHNSSFTGQIYGGNISGLVNSNSGLIAASYANSILVSNGGTASGFAYENIFNGEMNQDHSVGKIRGADINVGFIYELNTYPGIHIQNSYSAIWDVEGANKENTRPFIFNNKIGRLLDNGYLTSVSYDYMDNEHRGVKGYKSSKLKSNTNFGFGVGENKTFAYKQYTEGDRYPYPMPSVALNAYGDWGDAGTYTIHFDANLPGVDVQGSMDDITDIEYHDVIDLPSIAFSANGYKFMYWTVEGDKSNTKYKDRQKVSELAKSGTVVMKAHWLDPTYYIFDDKPQEFEAKQTGIYKLQVWGASGGNGIKAINKGNEFVEDTNLQETYGIGGKGGYSVGYVYLNAGDKLLVYTGGTGKTELTDGMIDGGYNGGGAARGYKPDWKTLYVSGSGGGATAITKLPDGAENQDFNELKDYEQYRDNVLIVAGGGGGAATYADGGAGGGIEGSPGSQTDQKQGKGSGGTSDVGGIGHGRYYYWGTHMDWNDAEHVNGAFGTGGGSSEAITQLDKSKPWKTSKQLICSGAGGGWYGGGSGYMDSYKAGAGGGSGYIKSSTQNAQFSGKSYDGNQEFERVMVMDEHDETEIGHTGNGCARITLIEKDNLNSAKVNSFTGFDESSWIEDSKAQVKPFTTSDPTIESNLEPTVTPATVSPEYADQPETESPEPVETPVSNPDESDEAGSASSEPASQPTDDSEEGKQKETALPVNHDKEKEQTEPQ
jgi:prepilin-type N-terminal cleavage/methylation domain-containing protein